MPVSRCRYAPLNVLHIKAGVPLVSHGGKSLHELREDVFDAARNSSRNAPSFDIYAAAMMGGEPYAVWN